MKIINKFMQRIIDNSDAISIIIQIIVAIVVPIILVRITGALNKRNRIEEQTFEHKRKIFENFLDILFDSLNIQGNGGKIDESGKNEKILDFKKKLILYASEETLYHFNKWMVESNENKKKNKDSKIIVKTDKFLYYLRKDLGLDDKSYKIGRCNKLQRIQTIIAEKIKQ